MSAQSSSLLERPESKLFNSASGYDLVADYYDHWFWQEFWRKNEFPVLLRKLLDAAPRRSVLDVGVGTGAFLSYAAPCLSPQLRLVGLDISSRMLGQARTRLGERVELLQVDLQQGLPLPDKSFDAVIMMRVANHLKNLSAVLCEIGRVLSSGGLFLATDLADDYDYFCTRIPAPETKISIETYKHGLTDWYRGLETNFLNVDIRDFTVSELSEDVLLTSKSLAKDAAVFKLVTATRK